VVPVNEPTIPADATLRDAVRAIEQTRRLIVAVVDAEDKLLGILSDGDIRRALLAGNGLDSAAAIAMTRDPIVTSAAQPEEWFALMRDRGVGAVPVVDDAGRFVREVDIYDFAGAQRTWTGGQDFAAAVIMAGGEGRRLLPMTQDRPKPMIDIGGVPLLERQVRAMARSGLSHIFIATNYLGHIIEDHFGDGSEFGAKIDYLRELRKLGTAGALSLLPEIPQGPILMINGDVVTTADFGKLLQYHRETGAFITVAATVHRVIIPFGVLRLEGHRAVAIDEKPSESYLCNAGIYVLEPKAIGLVAHDTHIDMTEVVNKAIAEKRQVSVFPIHEYWADIGSPGDLKQVLQEFSALVSHGRA
jgi:dTDP-glucose pyrophosphorylase